MHKTGVIHDPIYGVISLTETARHLIDTPAFQRLRRIKQLAMASWVYPSAVHTRFEHSLGVYHLTRQVVRRLDERGELSGISDEERELTVLSGLLHDLGHCAYVSHNLEEFGHPEACHEKAGEEWLQTPEVQDVLQSTGIPGAAEQVAEIVQHRGDHPLGGIVAGDCDADKIDYVVRDAYHCGFGIGFEHDRLLHCLTLVENPETGQREIGLKEKGLYNFEQLLYSKFNLFRSVYFHRAVRSATAMMRALVLSAIEAGLLETDELMSWTDDELFILLRDRVPRAPGRADPGVRRVAALTDRILSRRLYKEAASMPLRSAPDLSPPEVLRAEARIADGLGLEAGQALLDIPHKPSMLSTDILIERQGGGVLKASELGPDDGFALNAESANFYHASGRWALFTAERRDLSGDDLQAAVREALS